jgi:hypothetical protein
MEMVDILTPPAFSKTGRVKTKAQALKDSDWLGVFHLWIVQSNPEPAVVYQIRSPGSRWGPNLLDVTIGGYYQAGESTKDGLREAQEELGCTYTYSQLTYLGKKLFFGTDTKNHPIKSVVDAHFIKDDRPLDQYILQLDEVHGLVSCPLDQLIALHTHKIKSFVVASQLVTLDRFAYNWDNYHLKIALLAQRFLNGEKNLIY